MSNITLPNIQQHARTYRLFAAPSGRLVVYGLIAIQTMSRMAMGPRTRAFIVQSDHVLLVKNVVGRGLWTLPGGGVEAGESYEDCLVREVQEEIGIRVDPSSLRLIKHYDQEEVGEIYDEVCYLIDITDSGIDTVALNPEVLIARWYPLNQLPRRVASLVTLAVRDH